MVIMSGKAKILFLCTGNSCRSQMAEGFTRALMGDRFEAYSAGVEARGVDRRAVAVMKEAGVDISGQRSKRMDDLPAIDFDYVVTLCDQARESCPYFPARTKVLHEGFDDPPALVAGAASEEAALAVYRRVRDEIQAWIRRLPESLD
jgi:arsenate reductase